jgi:hypothetical protein
MADLPDARHTPGWLMLPAPVGHDEEIEILVLRQHHQLA